MFYKGCQNILGLAKCVKSVRIRSFSALYFPPFGLNTVRYSVSLSIQSKCGKIRTRKTPKTFYPVTVMTIDPLLI